MALPLLDPRSSVSTSPNDDGDRRPSLERAVTAALSTPHDAVLLELRGSRQIPGVDQASKAAEQPSIGRPSALPSVGLLEHPESQPVDGLPSGRQSSIGHATGASPEKDAIYDPYTGVLAGLILPQPLDQFQNKDGKKNSADFNQAKDDLWSHLGKIRELQSRIAGMHVQMEGLGPNDGARGSSKRPAVSMRMASDSIGVDDWADKDEQQNEQDAKKARDAEFSHLSESFAGRRDAIDGIMVKLDELSKALTTFHALPTPVVDFSQPASGHTRESHDMPSMPQSPSPPFSHPGSPLISPPMSPSETHAATPAPLKTADLNELVSQAKFYDSPTTEQAPNRRDTA